MTKKFDYRSGDPLDASLGLIMRLNKLWFEADDLACAGNFNGWNIKLDCIFRNLLFKEPLDYTISNGKVMECKLSHEDKIKFDYLNKNVKIALAKFRQAKTKTDYMKAKEELYHALEIKDIGLRKFMFTLKLYLKQGDGNPAHAMWGR